MIDLERVKHILVHVDTDGKLVIGGDDDVKQQSFKFHIEKRYKLEVWIKSMANGSISLDSGVLHGEEE